MRIALISLLLTIATQVMASTHIYTLFSDGMPNDAVVLIGDSTYTGLNAQGNRTYPAESLSAEDIRVKVGGGYIANVSVDNANYQVDIKFTQLFIPTESVKAETKYPYLLKMPLAYVKIDNNNLSHTTTRSDADQFIFVEQSQGQYYIYDVTGKRYLYYTSAENGSSVTNTTNSNVHMTTLLKTATTWQLLALSNSTVAIVPGSIENPTTASPALNFTGGINNNCVLNLWTADDSNSVWEIIDPSAGSLACATLMYCLPGAEYMHKLVPNEGETITDVDLSSIPSLTLRDERAEVGNKYKYVSGIAPTQEGEYRYTVYVKDAEGNQTQVPVRLIVSNFLQSPTPHMCWLTWNWFARSISHDKMVAIAKGMEKLGLIDAGFQTIILDDCWATPTSDKSALTYDPAKFPQGISGLKKALKSVNSKLKVGIYSDAGSLTCECYQPGSYMYETEHLTLFDSWGVDMLKYDYCNSEASTKVSYTRMGDAVKKINEARQANGSIPFVYNICEWGKTQPWLWGAEAGGSSWRATSDAREDWIGNNSRPGVLGGVDETRRLWMYAGVNHFNDLDMMCIGLHGLGGPSNNTMSHMSNGGTITGLTDAQARTQMSLWCMLASPLALTCDLRENPQGEANSGVTLPNPLITKTDQETLTNREILALNQDTLGQQAEYMEALSTGTTNYTTSGYDVYVKDLTRGRLAVSVTNRSTSAMSGIDIPLTAIYLQAGKKYTCREIWSGMQTEIQDTLTTGNLKACETLVYVLTPESDSTGITNLSKSNKDVVNYDLSGRAIQEPHKHQVTISKGSKRIKR